MTDFIDFLNTSDAEKLAKLEGLTSVQVESILSARPFTNLDDCTRISEMTKRKLTQLKKNWAEQNNPAKPKEATEIEPVEIKSQAVEQTESEQTKIEPEPVKEPEKTQPEPQKNSSTGKILRRVLIWLLILVMVAGAVYAAIVYGLPYLYTRYVKPVETNAENITDLAAQQENEIQRLNSEIQNLTGEINALQERALALETRADETEKSLKTTNENLNQLDKMQGLLDQRLVEQQDKMLSELDRQIKFTRALELISRSRLYLSQGNYGLAKEDLNSSRKLLYSMMEYLPKEQVGAMSIVIDRVDMALQNLPAYPVVAVYDVDTAWQLLVDGLPNVPEQMVTPIVLPDEETATPAVTEEALATETPTASETPAATPTR